MELKIRCPSCNASYRLKPALLPHPRVRLRCPRCQHVFPYTRPSLEREPPANQEPPAEAARTRDDDEAPELPFATGTPRKQASLPTESDVQEEGESLEDASLGEHARTAAESSGEGRESKKRRQPASRAGRFDFGDDDEFTLEPTEKDFADVDEPSPSERKKTKERTRRTSSSRGPFAHSDDRGQFRTLVVLVCGVVAFYAVITLSLFARPDRAQALIAQIPLVGQGVGEDRLWARRVRLEGVEATVQQTKDGRPVLVIAGKAMNTAASPLQAVRLSAELLYPDGKLYDEKTVFLGNMVSARVLRDLTPQEISILQQLSPPKQFALAPGEAASFAIVFFLDGSRQSEARRGEEMKYPSEFRLRVVTARRQG